MTAKQEAEHRLDDIVILAQSVVARAKAAQIALAKIVGPPERKEAES